MAPILLESSVLAGAGFRHGFFTRQGGASPAPFDSLHFGKAGHTVEHLAANVRAAAAALGVEPARLYAATQVHGRAAVLVRGDEAQGDVGRGEADVVATLAPGVACAVKVADCAPVLVADRRSGAVAAIHSGWQGTAIDVVAAGIGALRAALGDAGDLVAAIGPHIEVCCFEVGDDVASALAARAEGERVVDRARGPRPHVDLRRIVRRQLNDLGLDAASIDDVRGCTKCDAVRFFSYRRDRDVSGRLLAAIVAR